MIGKIKNKKIKKHAHIHTKKGIQDAEISICNYVSLEKKQQPSQQPQQQQQQQQRGVRDGNNSSDNAYNVRNRHNKNNINEKSEKGNVNSIATLNMNDSIDNIIRMNDQILVDFKLQKIVNYLDIFGLNSWKSFIDNQDTHNCKICFSAPASIISLPCRHCCVCHVCFQQIGLQNFFLFFIFFFLCCFVID